jgi:hypothetical protein
MEFNIELNGQELKIRIGRTLSSNADGIVKQVYIDDVLFQIKKKNGVCTKIFGGSNPLNPILMQQICRHIK